MQRTGISKHLKKEQRQVRVLEDLAKEADKRGISLSDAANLGLQIKLGYLDFDEAKTELFNQLDQVECWLADPKQVRVELAHARQLLSRWHEHKGLQKRRHKSIQEFTP